MKAGNRGGRAWCKRRGIEEQRLYELTKLAAQLRGLLQVFKKTNSFIHTTHALSPIGLQFIIISPLQSTAGYGLSDYSPFRSIFGCSHPALANRPAQIVTPPGLRASYTAFIETWSPFQNSVTPTVIGSTADMASPLPLQRANTVCYVGDFSFLPDHLVSDSIPQRIPEFKIAR
jgi:hypothetical protein